MSPPIYTPDGSEVSEIVLPDGSTASEVIDPDGNVVFEAGPDIPDSGLYLDDFEDGKFDSRDGYDVTPLNPEDLEPSTSNYGPPVRPEYSTATASTSNGLANFSTSDDLFASFNTNVANQNTTFRLEFDSISGDNFHWSFASETLTKGGDSYSNFWLDDSYVLHFTDTPSLKRFFRDDNGSRANGVFFEENLSSGDVIEVTRDTSGNFEFFINGTSIGNTTDTTYTNLNHYGLLQRGRTSSSSWRSISVF